MWDAITQLATNVGFSFPTLVWYIFLVGSIIFYASGFKHGLIISFLGNAALFIWFYKLDLYYVLPLVTMFLNLILMAFSFIAMSKTSARGYT